MGSTQAYKSLTALLYLCHLMRKLFSNLSSHLLRSVRSADLLVPRTSSAMAQQRAFAFLGPLYGTSSIPPQSLVRYCWVFAFSSQFEDFPIYSGLSRWSIAQHSDQRFCLSMEMTNRLGFLLMPLWKVPECQNPTEDKFWYLSQSIGNYTLISLQDECRPKCINLLFSVMTVRHRPW